MTETFRCGTIQVECKYPDICPICSAHISPERLHQTYNSKINKVFLMLQCPGCGESFISSYTDNINISRPNKVHSTTYISSYPKLPAKIDFNENIQNISSSFIDIYNQAYAAEVYELNQIAGMGYRKALEFLVKDYCSYRYPKDEQKIKNMRLAQVINEYIDSTHIQKLAKASAYIGNDETHYVRKFTDKDITDLKRFIKAIVYFLSYDLISEEAEVMVSSG